MLFDLLNELLTITTDLIEGFLLAFVGVKPTRKARRATRGTNRVRAARQPRPSRPSRPFQRRHSARLDSQLVLSEANWKRLAANLYQTMEPDVAHSTLQNIWNHATVTAHK